jgi:hypothetical protein
VSVSFQALRRMALALPGMAEGTSYGTPAFRARGKLLLRMWEDGETLVLRVDDDDEREALLAAQPRVFFVTDHYAGYPMLLVRLPRVRPALLRELVEKTWRRHAGKRAQAARAPRRRRA